VEHRHRNAHDQDGAGGQRGGKAHDVVSSSETRDAEAERERKSERYRGAAVAGAPSAGSGRPTARSEPPAAAYSAPFSL
jgi:hypothetical protein